MRKPEAVVDYTLLMCKVDKANMLSSLRKSIKWCKKLISSCGHGKTPLLLYVLYENAFFSRF